MRMFMLMLLLGCLVMTVGAGADLDSFLSKPEPAYAWKKVSSKQIGGGTVYELHLVSQTWQSGNWEHRLVAFFPDDVAYPHFCTLLNTGGSGSEREESIAMTVAKNAGTPFAILYNIPNQPLYDGRKEDALVVYTWLKFLETGDASWPLHFPMAKAVLKAMDALQDMVRTEGRPSLDRFLITGASKRGWTTWLDGASRDKRIQAIAPMVIDTLHVSVQIPHQLEAYGVPSEQVDDYTQADMFNKLNTPRGKRLMELEDPWSYRNRLTLPKLIILGTNDRYWAQDALNIYWDDLKGPKWVMYTPNSGHDLGNGILQVLGTLSAFTRAQASNTPWPKLSWKYTPPATQTGGIDLTVISDIQPKSARLYRTYSKTRDFRDSKWTNEPIPLDFPTGKSASYRVKAHLDAPQEGYAATYGELTYEIGGKSFALTTQIHILKAFE